jgi:hypothetical protein
LEFGIAGLGWYRPVPNRIDPLGLSGSGALPHATPFHEVFDMMPAKLFLQRGPDPVQPRYTEGGLPDPEARAHQFAIKNSHKPKLGICHRAEVIWLT